jgi:hypothetical protein
MSNARLVTLPKRIEAQRIDTKKQKKYKVKKKCLGKKKKQESRRVSQ